MAKVIEFQFVGVDKTTSAVRSATQNVQRFDKAIQSSARGTTQFGAAATGAQRSTKKFAMGALQQAGYQVGDYAVQVANGTSAMQAMGQQGSQLLGIFGPLGAVLGAGLAIFSAIGVAAQKAGGTIESFADEVDNLSDQFEGYRKLNVHTRQATLDLRDAFSDASEEVVKLFEAQKQLAEFNLATQMNETVIAMQKEFDITRKVAKETTNIFTGLSRLRQMEVNRLQLQEQAYENVGKAMNLNADQVKKLETEMKALEGLDIFANPQEGATLLGEIFEKVTAVGLDQIDKSGQTAIRSLLSLKEVMLSLRSDNIKSSRSMLGLIDLTGEEYESLSKNISKSMGNSFGNIIKGTESVKDAFKSMATAVVNELINILIVQRLVGAIGGAIDKAFPGSSGKEVSKQGAIGGTVQAGTPMVVGEKGREVFIPRSNGHLVPNHKLGSGGEQIVVNQSINISTGVAQTVRAEITQMMPQIQDAAKTAVIDARRRGGSFSTAFGA